jgi:hypothetical protein
MSRNAKQYRPYTNLFESIDVAKHPATDKLFVESIEGNINAV